jgi:hypothetical protein
MVSKIPAISSKLLSMERKECLILSAVEGCMAPPTIGTRKTPAINIVIPLILLNKFMVSPGIFCVKFSFLLYHKRKRILAGGIWHNEKEGTGAPSFSLYNGL